MATVEDAPTTSCWTNKPSVQRLPWSHCPGYGGGVFVGQNKGAGGKRDKKKKVGYMVLDANSG